MLSPATPETRLRSSLVEEVLQKCQVGADPGVGDNFPHEALENPLRGPLRGRSERIVPRGALVRIFVSLEHQRDGVHEHFVLAHRVCVLERQEGVARMQTVVACADARRVDSPRDATHILQLHVDA